MALHTAPRPSRSDPCRCEVVPNGPENGSARIEIEVKGSTPFCFSHYTTGTTNGRTEYGQFVRPGCQGELGSDGLTSPTRVTLKWTHATFGKKSREKARYHDADSL